MIYESDVLDLITKWQLEMADSRRNTYYQNALFDCIFDLRDLVNRSLNEEFSVKEAEKIFVTKDLPSEEMWNQIKEQEYDDYLHQVEEIKSA